MPCVDGVIRTKEKTGFQFSVFSFQFSVYSLQLLFFSWKVKLLKVKQFHIFQDYSSCDLRAYQPRRFVK